MDISNKSIQDLTGIQDFASLKILYCNNNNLSSLDISSNTALTNIDCAYNHLTSLNVKNGNNYELTEFHASDNPDLTCIKVDDPEWSLTNWTDIDSTASFSTNCNISSSNSEISSEDQGTYSVYPNPTNGNISIKFKETKNNIKIAVINSLGQNIISKTVDSANNINLNIDASPGIYILRIGINRKEHKQIKVVKK